MDLLTLIALCIHLYKVMKWKKIYIASNAFEGAFRIAPVTEIIFVAYPNWSRLSMGEA